MSVNMSLDEIIKASKSVKRGAKTTGKTSFGGIRKSRPGLSGGARAAAKTKIRGFGDNIEGKWKHDKFNEVNSPPATKVLRVGGGGNPNAKVTISVTNLDPLKIQAEDLEDLFGDFAIESAVVHFDAEGNSLGTGAVTCTRAVAQEILKQFSSVKLDGRQLKLAIVGNSSGIESRVSFSSPLSGRISKDRAPARRQAPALTRGRKFNKSFRAKKTDGAGRHPLDRLESDDEGKPARGKGPRGKKAVKSMEELDAELDSYMKKN